MTNFDCLIADKLFCTSKETPGQKNGHNPERITITLIKSAYCKIIRNCCNEDSFYKSLFNRAQFLKFVVGYNMSDTMINNSGKILVYNCNKYPKLPKNHNNKIQHRMDFDLERINERPLFTMSISDCDYIDTLSIEKQQIIEYVNTDMTISAIE